MRTRLPSDPFALARSPSFEPAARRRVWVLGAPVELVWTPERARRRGRPGAGRLPFSVCPSARILAEETVWRNEFVALTPNRYPLGERCAILWRHAPEREADAALLEVGLALAEATRGSLLLNTIGAAASIARAHAHLLSERSGFLESFGRRPWNGPDPGLGGDVEVYTPGERFPGPAVGVSGPLRARAAAAAELLRRRLRPAANLVAVDDMCWVFARTRETPAPHFPHALGAGELWGRFFYTEREDFERASPADLETALRVALADP